MMKHNDNRLLLWIIPLFIMGWGIFSLLFFDTFYSRAVDPEYPYLINGLNVSMLKFKMIGHFDHPGTPFQIFCGIIIRITHLLTGKGSLAQDVFNRPDYYLSAISLSLTVLQSALTLIVGTTGRQSKLKTSQLILLQAGILFNFLMLELFFRVIPERWLVVTALLFVICYLRYGYKDSRPMKFALWSGVVMGMGMATKFNFLPVLFLPFLLMPTAKTRLIYAGTTLLSFFVFIAPILSKFKEFYRFINAIATHDGIYGQGKEQMFNFAVMKENIGHVIHTAPELSILFMLIVAAVIIGFLYRKRGQLTHSPFLFAGIILIIALQLLMVSKHYKNTYLVPLFSFYSLFLFLSDDFFSKLFRQSERYIFIATLSTCIFFVGITLKRTIDVMPDLSNQKAKREELRQYVSQNLSDSTLWFTEPSWESAPYVENGIVYGISYCGRRTFYREELFRKNPNIITYEGQDEPLAVWRNDFVSLDSILVTNTPLHIYSTSGRNADKLIDMVNRTAQANNIDMQTDTLFSQKETSSYIIAMHNPQGDHPLDMDQILKSSRVATIAHHIREIRNSPHWMETVRQKAQQQNIPLDTMLLLDAVWMTDNP